MSRLSGHIAESLGALSKEHMTSHDSGTSFTQHHRNNVDFDPAMDSIETTDVHSRRGTALQADPAYQGSWSGDDLEREERSSLRRVAGLDAGVEREEGVDIEYRQVRLERVILVGLWTEGLLQSAEDSLRELAALAETAGSEVLDGIIQKRDLPDPATYLGKGKAHELAELVASKGADTVIADSELAPSQRRALEDIVQVKVIDRTSLILDIFARHAKSREGKAQVELAQLEYLLPRLRGWGESMSRQAGGRVVARCRYWLTRSRRNPDRT